MHFNMTRAWGVGGVDLGANAEHAGRTFIYFGDVPKLRPDQAWPPQDGDLVAFLGNIEVPPGASLATARQLDDQLNVFFIGSDGSL